MTVPFDFHHALKHAVRYVGEAATVAEKLDHPHERVEAIRLAKEFIEKRRSHVGQTWGALFKELAAIVEAHESGNLDSCDNGSKDQ